MLTGPGALVFQREKQYFSFRIFSTLFLVLGVALGATVSYFLYTYIYSKFNMYYISATVIVLFVGVYNLLVSLIFRKYKYNFYLYENSFAYAFDSVFTLSVIFTLDMSLSIANFFMMLLAILIVIFVTSLVIGFFIKNSNRGYLNVCARNVPAKIFLLAIFSIVLYYLSLLVI